ncbi:MAG TPA: prolyl oligopeptidase family serine peptidase [Gemmatirosa sp.]|nr:prolyl oligopeptidase family serine peptidase [Gemmatirosa sp.]
MPPFTPGRRARTSALPTALALAALGASPTLRAQAVATPPSSAPVPASSRATPASIKRPLAQADYDQWRTATGVTLSRDGRWLAYTATPQVGDGDLIVRSTRGAQEVRVPRGFVGRPQLQPNADSGWTAPPATFSADSRVLAALVYAPRAEFEGARRERRKPEQQPKATLAVVSLADGQVRRVPRVKSFAMPREAGGWLAYLLEPAEGSAPAGTADAVRDTSARAAGVAAATPGGTPRPIAAPDSTAGRGRKREYGSTLVVRNLATGEETQIADVATYALADSGRWLAYTVSSRTEARDGAYLRPLGARLGDESTLLAGKGEYKALVFDRAGRQVAFVSNRDDAGRQRPRWTLYHARAGAAGAAAIVAPRALDTATVLSDRGLAFVRDGSTIVFGLSPAPLDSIPADSLADKAVLDVWHWREPRLQPQQRVELSRERGRGWTAAYHVAERRWVRLGNDTLQRVTLSDDGRTALALAELPYAVAQMWGEGGADVVVLDARTGRRTTVATRVPNGATLSPSGRWVTWFADGRWSAHDVRAGRTVDLTGRLAGVDFSQAETWDTPSAPPAWGIAGWTEGERSFLAYSRRDVWELDPEGRRPARVLTDSVGVRTGTTFRLVTLDRDARYVDAGRPVLLEAFDDRTKQSGFWRDRIGAAALPERLVMADARYVGLQKARDADVYLAGRQTVGESELVVGERLDALAPATQLNPQQAQYRWGAAELVHWRSADGVPLDGLLYRPEGFDPSRRYPMVVYFYEQLSDNLHQYHAPAGRNVVNPIVYASNGYLVFLPDIHYQTGYPGQSSLESIVPGVQALVARGFVDERAIGIAGQSWGGYQSAWMITQTPLFRAAFLGAPVANMTSAYGGIRWESGVARPFQYERGQSRIGKTLWDAPLRYVENSPLFYIDRVTTPMLIMSNDADGAVPWYQGIELFVAARRFGKEAYLLNYNGDGHNPRKRANQLDVDRRMQQFFAHHLKGEPAPEWMRQGIPFLQKGRDQLTPAAAVAAQQGGGAPSSGTPAPGAGGTGATGGATGGTSGANGGPGPSNPPR